MDTDRKLTDKTGKKPRTLSYKYSFRLNEEQNIRFNELLCKAGSEHNRSRFIVKRSFCEEFTATKRDPSKTQFVGRRNDFYFQFQQLANNYSQVVKIVNQHFSNVAIPPWNSARGSWKPLSIEIQTLAKRAVERLRIQGQVPRMEGRYVTTRKRSIKMKPRCSSGRRCSNRSTNTDDWM